MGTLPSLQVWQENEACFGIWILENDIFALGLVR